MEDRRLAIREVADEVGISRGSANKILTEDLGMRRVAAKFVPKLLLTSTDRGLYQFDYTGEKLKFVSKITVKE